MAPTAVDIIQKQLDRRGGAARSTALTQDVPHSTHDIAQAINRIRNRTKTLRNAKILQDLMESIPRMVILQRGDVEDTAQVSESDDDDDDEQIEADETAHTSSEPPELNLKLPQVPFRISDFRGMQSAADTSPNCKGLAVRTIIGKQSYKVNYQSLPITYVVAGEGGELEYDCAYKGPIVPIENIDLAASAFYLGGRTRTLADALDWSRWTAKSQLAHVEEHWTALEPSLSAIFLAASRVPRGTLPSKLNEALVSQWEALCPKPENAKKYIFASVTHHRKSNRWSIRAGFHYCKMLKLSKQLNLGWFDVESEARAAAAAGIELFARNKGDDTESTKLAAGAGLYLIFSIYRAHLKDSRLLDINAEDAGIADWVCRCIVLGERHVCPVCLKLVHCEDWTKIEIHALSFNACEYRCPSCAIEHERRAGMSGARATMVQIAEREGCTMPDEEEVEAWLKRGHQDAILPALGKLRLTTADF